MADILAICLNPAVDVSCETEQVHSLRKIRTHNQSYDPGGGGVNVARVIATLGEPVELIYPAGGATGALLEDCLFPLKIDAKKVEIRESTRISYTVHETKTGFEYRFVPEGPKLTPAEMENAFTQFRKFNGKYFVGSGSLPKGSPVDTYARLARLANENSARCILDTCDDALRAALDKTKLFLIKPSLRELQKLVGETLDEKQAQLVALELVKKGHVENVVVSMGAQGAFLANAEGIFRSMALLVIVQSAVGAGDSFVGAMTLALARGKSVEYAFRFGVAAGTAAVMTAGTKLCRYDDVWRMFDENPLEPFSP